jgi:metal-responsive CopG/Arc/MetJ family transcriptional regulator
MASIEHNKNIMSFSLKAVLRARLERYKRISKRSKSDIIRQALDEYLKKHEDK